MLLTSVMFVQVHWWRVVFDEAQLAGGGFSATAVMATRVTAQHRWAVTGTPIGTGGTNYWCYMFFI